MKIKVNNKVVGEVVDNTFIKNLNSDKHFLKKPPAIAFDISSLNNASISGAVYVKINDTKTDSDEDTVFAITVNRNEGIENVKI